MFFSYFRLVLAAAEYKRKHPNKKVVSVMWGKDKMHQLTSAVRPIILEDKPLGNSRSHKVSRYAIVFEETIILRKEDLQMSDSITLHLWKRKNLKQATTKTNPIAKCRVSVGDMYTALHCFYDKQIKLRELLIASKVQTRQKCFSRKVSLQSHKERYILQESISDKKHETLLVPPLQEYAMMKPLSKKNWVENSNIGDAIREEMASIKKAHEETSALFKSDSSDESESDLSFVNDIFQRDADDYPKKQVLAMEQLHGHITLSFFPILW